MPYDLTGTTFTADELTLIEQILPWSLSPTFIPLTKPVHTWSRHSLQTGEMILSISRRGVPFISWYSSLKSAFYFGHHTTLPLIIVIHTEEVISRGFPSNIARSASFPAFKLPRRWSTRQIFAASIVMARRAACSPKPSFAASAAHRGKYWMRETGWSVVNATGTPDL